MVYEEAVKYIELVPWQARTVGLERINALLELLGRPQEHTRFIHVAGTNGKGSVCSMLASVLQHAGYKTGLFTSPHLLKYNERIRIDGQDISDAAFAAYTERIAQVIPKMSDTPTVFEVLTAIGMLYFADMKCDVVVLEVGMGGEFDSTNIIKHPLVSVITSIGYDHMAQLGPTLRDIASAKSGIIKSGCPTVVFRQENEILGVFRDKAGELASDLYIAEPDDVESVAADIDGQSVYSTQLNRQFKLSLVGSYQLVNLSLVLKTIYVLNSVSQMNISVDAIVAGLSSVSWPARFEVLMRSPVFILDGAHNTHGVNGAVSALKQLFPDRRIHYIVGILRDKGIDQMLELMISNAASFYTLTPDSGRACDADELYDRIRALGYNCKSCADVSEAVTSAIEDAGEDGIICSMGSLYLAGAVREYILNRI